MKKIHLIHAKDLKDTEADSSLIISLLEKEALIWAQYNQPSAYQQTIDIKNQLATNTLLENKYYKYLKRLLEIKLQTLEDLAKVKEEKGPELAAQLVNLLNIESLRLPEYLSCTQLGLWKTCQRKWYWRYAVGIKTPKTAALQFGSAVDEALNYYYEERLKGTTPPKEALYERFRDVLDREAQEVEWGEADPDKLRAQGPAIIDAYLDAFDSKTQPIAVQQKVNVHLDNNGVLIGAIDILEKDSIVDTKTAKEPWKENKHQYELQPKAYSLWFLEEFGSMPKEFRYQIVCKDECRDDDKPRTQLIAFEVKKFEVERFRRQVQETWDTINKALYLGKEAFAAEAAKDRPSPLCCAAYCEFADLCRKDGLQVADKWDKVRKCHVYPKS